MSRRKQANVKSSSSRSTRTTGVSLSLAAALTTDAGSTAGVLCARVPPAACVRPPLLMKQNGGSTRSVPCLCPPAPVDGKPRSCCPAAARESRRMAVSADSVLFLFTLSDAAGLLFLAVYAVSHPPIRHLPSSDPRSSLSLSRLTADHSVRPGLRSPECQ